METIKFGNYWQNNDKNKETIEWFVLSERDGKTLLLSKYALDCKSYHERCSITTWGNCDLRKWLHSDFMDKAFSEEEQQIIILTKNDTKGSRTTEDKVFLLSVEEANTYLTQEERKCRPTPYAKLHNAWSSVDNFCNFYNFCIWWLRSLSDDQGSVANVDNGGGVDTDGYHVGNDSFAVRVAMWIDSSKLEKIKNNGNDDENC